MLETRIAIIIRLFDYHLQVHNCFVKVRIKTNVLVFSLATLVLRYILVSKMFPFLLANDFAYLQ